MCGLESDCSMVDKIGECSPNDHLSTVPVVRAGSTTAHAVTPSSCAMDGHNIEDISCTHKSPNGSCSNCKAHAPPVSPAVSPTFTRSPTSRSDRNDGSKPERETSNVGQTRRQRKHISPLSSGVISDHRGRTDSISHSRREPGESIVDSMGIIYRIGQQVGRGGFGVVYQALNTATGDWVAVKCIALQSIDNEALASIRSEIDLLKKLNHVNIVKYIDSIQTERHLNIVLEMMESSLSAMCKKFGNFSESLTAVYMSQVLHGLCYLHDQGVLHRDIKGANILTTKTGLLKLADFGVAKKLTDAASINEETDVVGTPYWMAPEMIEMTGLTTACDIWSVGITIIELVNGNPPYYDLPPMQALYRIVQDDHPPLPDTLSSSLKDFLLLCFRKEPEMRKNATELLEHPWLMNDKAHLKRVGRDALSMQADKSRGKSRQVVLKTVRAWANNMRHNPNRRPSLKDSEMEDINNLADKLFHDLDKVILSPVENGPSSPGQSEEEPKNAADGKKLGKLTISSSDEGLDWDKESSIEDIPGDKQSGTVEPPASSEHVGNGGRNLNMVSAENSVRHQQQKSKSVVSGSYKSEVNSVSTAVNSSIHGPTPASKFLEESLDTDTLADWREEDAYDYLGNPSVNIKVPRRSNVLGLEFFEESEEDENVDFWEDFSDGKIHVKHPQSSNLAHDSVSLSDNSSFLPGEKGPGSPSSTFADVLRKKIHSRQMLTLGKIELDDEWGNDFDFNLEGDTSNETAACDALMKVGNEVYGELYAVDSSSGISLKSTSQTITEVCLKCSRKLIATPEARFYVLSPNHGAIVLVNMLNKSNADSIRSIIALINDIVDGNVRDLEHVAVMGMIPDIIAHVDSQDIGLRFEVAKFVYAVCSGSPRTFEMFVCAGGLKVLVELLHDLPGEIDPASSRAMIKVGMDGILDVFQLQQARRNDICRLFLNLGLLPRILYLFKMVLDRAIVEHEKINYCDEERCSHHDEEDYKFNDGSEWSLQILERIAHVLVTFSKSDRIVKDGLIGADGISTILDVLPRIYPRFAYCNRIKIMIVALLNVVKNISMETSALWLLTDPKKIDVLVKMLERTGRPCDHRIEGQVLQCMFYLCRLSKKRQEMIATAGLIPYLIRCISEGQNLKQFAISIFCDLAYSTPRVRDLLCQHNGIDFFIEIIESDQVNWHAGALRSIAAWARVDTERVEKKLVEPHALSCIVSLFKQQPVFEAVVVELDSLTQSSTLLVKELGERKEFMEVVATNLYYPNAIVVKSLLNMLFLVFQHHSAPEYLIRDFDLYASVSKLAGNHVQVLVAELASQLLRVFDDIVVHDWVI